MIMVNGEKRPICTTPSVWKGSKMAVPAVMVPWGESERLRGAAEVRLTIEIGGAASGGGDNEG